MADAVRITGLTETAAHLKALQRDLSDFRGASDRIASNVADAAASAAPRLTGALAGSIRVVTTPGAAVVRAGEGLTYAIIQDRRTNFLRGPGNDETKHRTVITSELVKLIQQNNLA